MSSHGLGYGFTLDDAPLVNHPVWCDNIDIIAESAVQFAMMVQELTDVIYSNKPPWKPSSLECLRGGTLIGESLSAAIT